MMNFWPKYTDKEEPEDKWSGERSPEIGLWKNITFG